MNSSDLNFQIIHLNSVDSTNSYAFDLIRAENVGEGTVIHADYQVKGRGQSSKMWESSKAKNLLFSLIIEPCIRIEDQFEISKIIALGIKNYLDRLAVGKVEVKWPNDILVDGEKIAGILIQNLINGTQISSAVIGIGININQTSFTTFSRKATSLKLKTAKKYDLKKELNEVLVAVFNLYKQYQHTKNKVQFHQQYINSLHRKGEEQKFKDAEGEFIGVIVGVLPNGYLQINKEGKLKTYELKEVEFLVD